jgi:hypothetical protein
MNIFKSKWQRMFENLFKSIFSILKMIILVRRKGNRIVDFSDKKDFVILGNGPSLDSELQRIDQSIIKNADLICVNHFPSSDDYEKVKPRFYVTGAPDLWLDNIDQHFVDDSNKLFKNIAEKTTWELQLFIPFEAKKYARWQSHLKENENVHIRYYNNNAVEGIRSLNYFTYKRQLGMPRPHNVMIPCLSLTLQPFVNSIMLLGVGHTFLKEIFVSEENEVLIHQQHFYDKKTSKPKPLDKRGKGKRNLYELLSKLTLAFYGYHVIREYADYLGVKIYNGTKGSYIDAFDRISIEDYSEKLQRRS